MDGHWDQSVTRYSISTEEELQDMTVKALWKGKATYVPDQKVWKIVAPFPDVNGEWKDMLVVVTDSPSPDAFGPGSVITARPN